jgi:hypothetical protein
MGYVVSISLWQYVEQHIDDVSISFSKRSHKYLYLNNFIFEAKISLSWNSLKVIEHKVIYFWIHSHKSEANNKAMFE